jgi:hypothetical protein
MLNEPEFIHTADPKRRSCCGEKHSFERRRKHAHFPVHAASHLGRPHSYVRAGFAVRPLHLNVGELLEVSDGKGLAVRCLEGCVWIPDPMTSVTSCLMYPALPSFARPPPPRHSQLKQRSCASSRRTQSRRQSAGMLRGPVTSGRVQAMNRYTLMTFITILAKTIRNGVR